MRTPFLNKTDVSKYHIYRVDDHAFPADKSAATRAHLKFGFGKGFFALLSILIGVFICMGCQSQKTSMKPEPPPTHVPYLLSAGDIVSVSFSGAPELDQEQVILSDGKLNLPIVGEVVAAGKTLAQLQRDVTRLYKPHLQAATVLVRVTTTSVSVYVTGAVLQAGKIPLTRPMTALEAIMEAGGFSPGLANPKKVILVREVKGEHLTRTLDLSRSLRGETTTGAVYLQPYDVIIVREKLF